MQERAIEIAENLQQLRAEVAQAALDAGRKPEEVRLVAVSKTKPVEDIRAALEAGQLLFGENRVQELVPKAEALPQAEWHLVGHLQRNKVKYIAGFVALIHSLDSVELLAEIEKQGTRHNRRIPCLVQVNISDEQQKNGCAPEGVKSILEAARQCPHVEIRGLMGIAQETDDKAAVRAQFQSLRQLRDALQSPYLSDSIRLTELSMGMSGDFRVAIAEGATLIRIGSAVFGRRG